MPYPPMKPFSLPASRIITFVIWFVCTFDLARAQAQAATADTPTTSANQETVQLSVFEVASTRDSGYRATNSVSGTRINLKLMDVPQTISVLTADFIQDLGAVDLDE